MNRHQTAVARTRKVNLHPRHQRALSSALATLEQQAGQRQKHSQEQKARRDDVGEYPD